MPCALETGPPPASGVRAGAAGAPTGAKVSAGDPEPEALGVAVAAVGAGDCIAMDPEGGTDGSAPDGVGAPSPPSQPASSRAQASTTDAAVGIAMGLRRDGPSVKGTG